MNAIFKRAQQVIPGGVNSPVRAFRSVDREPVFIARANGASLFDINGAEYTDYICSWGPMILGHRHAQVEDAVHEALLRGTSYGLPTEAEVVMAEVLCRAVPCLEMVRMVSSGTEAVMSALRVARGFTGRSHIVKFEGCYHGHSDAMLVKAGSGLATAGTPDSGGVTPDAVSATISLPYNSVEHLQEAFTRHGYSIGAVIVEPVAANMGVVPPEAGFLQALRDMTTKYGALLIFDEVITGFRLGIGGAQEYYGITPDLATFGKIIGGGLPVGAYGGRREIMEQIAPLGGVYQAGTLSGNPMAMAAGLATLEVLINNPDIYASLASRMERVMQGLRDAIKDAGVPAAVQSVGSLGTLFFLPRAVKSWDDAKCCDTKMYAKFFSSMLEQGIMLAPSQYEAMFISAAHTESHAERFVCAAASALRSL